MKLLDGRELAGYVQERQMHQARGLRQADHVVPRLAIVRTNPEPVADSYMNRKKAYGDEILAEVDVHTIDQTAATDCIKKLNADPSVHGIIVQLPLPDPSQTEELLNLVAPEKDVDGLSANPAFDPATPLAILWLLAGYNVDLKGKHIVVVGQGRLVGKPLTRMLQASGYEVATVDKLTTDVPAITREADIIITATGHPGLITPDMIKQNAVIVDAGVASNSDGLVGDVAPAVRELPDITITPLKGGVGPLTVCALFDNVIRAARASIKA